MRFLMKNSSYIIIVIFAASFAFASEQEGKDLFEAKCGSCHSLERSLRKTKGLRSWKRTIKRMAGYLIEKYAFQIPSDAVSPLTVEAVLKYRSASQSLAKDLLGESAPKIPVIDMVSLVDKIEF